MPQIGNTVAACEAVDLSRATFYRIRGVKDRALIVRKRCGHPRALSAAEEQRVLDVLHEDRFVDKAPAEIVAQLLDQGIYLCSGKTMYRILHRHSEVKERRKLLRHPKYQKPELQALKPNQVWSWDITRLKGPQKGTYYNLYVIIDIFSRYVVGWLIAETQDAELAELLILETCWRQSIEVDDELFIHSDRGGAMTSNTVSVLLSNLGVIRSLSRPRVSNDNPYSEAQFKTLKYRPNFPNRFGSIQDARVFCRAFFEWYNNEHHHSGIAWMTPATVHYGNAKFCAESRQVVLDEAFRKHANRFVNGRPKSHLPPEEVWINKPQKEVETAQADATTTDGIIIGGD